MCNDTLLGRCKRRTVKKGVLEVLKNDGAGGREGAALRDPTVSLAGTSHFSLQANHVSQRTRNITAPNIDCNARHYVDVTITCSLAEEENRKNPTLQSLFLQERISKRTPDN
jgi:hypothetical protein